MTNVGTADRLIRAILGLALMATPWPAGWPAPWLMAGVAVGLVILATSAFSFCPIYALVGLSSKRRG
jgi:hypothetical protein